MTARLRSSFPFTDTEENSADHTTYVPLQGAREYGRVRSVAAQRDARRRGKPVLEPHRPVLRRRQVRARMMSLTLLTWSQGQRRSGTSGRCTSSATPTAGSWRTTWPARGLPGLWAVASLAGTSYVEDTSCDGADPVSVLHIHGTEDDVILFDGDESDPDPKGDGERAFYAGPRHGDALEPAGRLRLPEHPQPYATLDLDQYVPGPETRAFRLESGCADGINIELWMGAGSSHSPGYGDASRTPWLTGFCHKISRSALLGSSSLSTSCALQESTLS